MVLGAILRSILTWLSKRKLPIIDGKLRLPGLISPVEIIRDKWGIPHIYAANNHDLIFAQGFVHAQDRFWQMEQNRRLSTGRLSEVFGDIALDTDRTCRTLGFARLGEEDWEKMDEELKGVIIAYTEGINAFLEHPSSKLPVEFTLLRFKPEPWTIEDSMAYARFMFWKLSFKFYSKLVRKMLIDAVGEHATELEIQYPKTNPNTLANGIEFNILNTDGSLLKGIGPFLDQGMGSNSWVINRSKSTDGNTFLCNDMHLELTLPGIWYENHLISKDFNVSGVTTPGVPLVHVGHNANIAWGMTLAYTDCDDLFIEKLNPDNPDQYEFNGEWLNLEIIPEEIKVKGKEPQIENIKITDHGPIISDVINYPNLKLSLKSMSLQPAQDIKGWYSLNKAESWNDFVNAARCLSASHLNVTFADTKGNVGYWVTGDIPIRKKGDGSVPVSGWTGEFEWIDKVPFEEMPHTLNPEKGYLVSCNHKIVPDDFPYHLSTIWMNGYRAKRFDEIIERKQKVSTEDFKEMHTDFMSIPGQEFIELLKGIEISEIEIQGILNKLLEWNGNLDPISVGATIYETTRYFLVRNLLESALSEELTTVFMGEAFHPLLYPTHDFYGHDTVVLLRLLKDPENNWWIKQAGGRDVLLVESLLDAFRFLRKKLGDNMENWQWGKIHKAVFPHAMALQKPLDKVFNRGNLPIGGDTDTLCQTAVLPSNRKELSFKFNAWGPGHRQIINMENLEKSLMISVPGQSGHLGSPHYDDSIDLWINGEYHPMLWTREKIEANAEGTLKLEPEN